jgi:hypothetical protein
MPIEISELDQMQAAYKAAVEEWIAAIKQEETLASVNHSVAEVEQHRPKAARAAKSGVRGRRVR